MGNRAVLLFHTNVDVLSFLEEELSRDSTLVFYNTERLSEATTLPLSALSSEVTFSQL